MADDKKKKTEDAGNSAASLADMMLRDDLSAKAAQKHKDAFYNSDEEDEGDEQDIEFEGDGTDSDGEDEDEYDTEEEDETGDDDEDETSEGDEEDETGEDNDEDETSDDDETGKEEVDYSATDLKHLTQFPKELRGDIAKLPKAAQSKLVAFLSKQNEEKRQIAKAAKEETVQAGKEYTRAAEIRKACSDDYLTIKKALEEGKGNMSKEAAAQVEKLLESHKKLIASNFQLDFGEYWKASTEAVTPDIRAFLTELGKKPEKFAAAYPREAQLLYLAAIWAKPEERKAALNKLRFLVERAGKAATQKKTRPRPAGSSQRNRVGHKKETGVSALSEMLGAKIG